MRLDIVFVGIFLFTFQVGHTEDVSSQYGERQVAQVIDDRPQMAGLLPIDDVIYRWVARKFESGYEGKRVYWDQTPPEDGHEASNKTAYQGYPALISLSDSVDISGRDLWCSLVFELENLQSSSRGVVLEQQVIRGQLDRKAFSEACVKLEFSASLRARRFFRRYPIPGATAENAPYYTSLISMNDDFESYLAWLTTRAGNEYDPVAYFAARYDQLEAYYKK